MAILLAERSGRGRPAMGAVGPRIARDQFVAHEAGKRPALLAVLALHAGLIALLVTGTGQRLVSAVREPVKVALLEPAERPPPPEPAPLPPPPPLQPPSPVFVPPPEVHIARPRPVPPVVQSTPERAAAPAPPTVPTVSAAAPTIAAARPRKEVGAARDLSRPAKIVVAKCDQPVYPAVARRQEATGTSRIRFEVDAQGRVVSAEVVQRSGRSRAHRQLDAAAVDALSQCQFTPGRDKHGLPVGGHASVDYVWQIE
jgi:periplasmic protein TonB